MNKFRILSNSLLSIIAVLGTVFYADSSLAQRRPGNIDSLGEMGCQSIGDGEYDVENNDIPIGREVIRSVATLTTNWHGTIWKGEDQIATVSCRLGDFRESTPYRYLNLAFGLNSSFSHIGDMDRTLVRLSVYLDGEFHGYRDIRNGDKLFWPIDVQGVRSVSLEGECIRPINSLVCPGVSFFEDTLER